MSDLLRRPRRRHATHRAGAHASGSSPRRCSKRRPSGLLAFDVYTKRVASRLLAQFRIARSAATPTSSERLAQDLLFFCAQAAPAGDGRTAPRLAAVRQAYGLRRAGAGRLRSAASSAASTRRRSRRRASASPPPRKPGRRSPAARCTASPAWPSSSRWSAIRCSSLYPAGETLAAALQTAVAQTVQPASRAAAPSWRWKSRPACCTSKPSLEDGDFDHPEQADRVQRLARAPRRRAPAAAARSRSKPWMEELYRRVSDRQTMGSVVQELRASLSEIEKPIDQFFRDPAQRDAADRRCRRSWRRCAACCRCSAWTQASQARAAHARRRRRPGLDRGRSPSASPTPASFDRLAGNLGALGFLIDMLSVQPQMAKSLFALRRRRAARCAPVMGRSARPSAGARRAGAGRAAPDRAGADARVQLGCATTCRCTTCARPRAAVARGAGRRPAGAGRGRAEGAGGARSAPTTDDSRPARGELSEAMVDFVATASSRPLDAGAAAGAAARAARADADGQTTSRTTTRCARSSSRKRARSSTTRSARCAALARRRPTTLGELTTVRRAFHTLKGSSRMVGLKRLRRSRLGLRAALQHAACRAARGRRRRCSTFTAESARLPRRLGRGHRRRRAQAARRRAVRRAPTLRAPSARADAAHASSAAPRRWPRDRPARRRRRPARRSACRPSCGPRRRPSQADGRSTAARRCRARRRRPTAPMQRPRRRCSPPTPRSRRARASSSSTRAAPAPRGRRAAGCASATRGAAAPAETPADARPTSRSTTAAERAARRRPAVDARRSRRLRARRRHATPARRRPTVARRDAELPPASDVAAADADVARPLPDARDRPKPADAPRSESSSDAERGQPQPTTTSRSRSVGPLRIGIPLFNIFLNEADELSRRLATELAEWAIELHRPVGESAIALAHSLAGSSATVGFADLSHLARALEHALTRSHAHRPGRRRRGAAVRRRRRRDPPPAAPVRRRLPEGARRRR